jgi:hypothetical protein
MRAGAGQILAFFINDQDFDRIGICHCRRSSQSDLCRCTKISQGVPTWHTGAQPATGLGGIPEANEQVRLRYLFHGSHDRAKRCKSIGRRNSALDIQAWACIVEE